MKWFAVHTAAGKEALANLWLGRRGFETYWPHEKIEPRWVRSSSSKTLSELVNRRSSIPRYLFVRTVPERFADVNDTLGVSTLVFSPGGEPFPIEPEILEELRSCLAAKRRQQKPAGEFPGVIGDVVRGREGWPHWGLFAQIVRIAGQTVAVRMMMLGASREISVPAASLEVVDGVKA